MERRISDRLQAAADQTPAMPEETNCPVDYRDVGQLERRLSQQGTYGPPRITPPTSPLRSPAGRVLAVSQGVSDASDYQPLRRGSTWSRLTVAGGTDCAPISKSNPSRASPDKRDESGIAVTNITKSMQEAFCHDYT